MSRETPRHARLHRIVVVGGGAGGLELATRLGDKLGRRGKAHVTLVEKARTHFWKPHLHEIAAGSIDINNHAIDYLAQSHWHGFRYRLGAMGQIVTVVERPSGNLMLGLGMLIGRFGYILPVLALAGSLAMKKTAPIGQNSFPTHGPLFVTLLTVTILLVGGLTFLPTLALGPIAEHLSMGF
jgi:hypothetical protein